MASQNQYRIKATQNTNEKAEALGYNIDGLPFVNVIETTGGKMRGYVRVPLFGMASIDKGPVILNKDDLEMP